MSANKPPPRRGRRSRRTPKSGLACGWPAATARPRGRRSVRDPASTGRGLPRPRPRPAASQQHRCHHDGVPGAKWRSATAATPRTPGQGQSAPPRHEKECVEQAGRPQSCRPATPAAGQATSGPPARPRRRDQEEDQPAQQEAAGPYHNHRASSLSLISVACCNTSATAAAGLCRVPNSRAAAAMSDGTSCEPNASHVPDSDRPRRWRRYLRAGLGWLPGARRRHPGSRRSRRATPEPENAAKYGRPAQCPQPVQRCVDTSDRDAYPSMRTVRPRSSAATRLRWR